MQINQPYYNPYPTRTNNSIIWVQGLEGAKAYQLMPNSNVVLMDSDSDRFFIKSADNVGMCTLRSFKYEEEHEKPKEEYVTKAELQALIESLKGAKDESAVPGNEQ